MKHLRGAIAIAVLLANGAAYAGGFVTQKKLAAHEAFQAGVLLRVVDSYSTGTYPGAFVEITFDSVPCEVKQAWVHSEGLQIPVEPQVRPPMGKKTFEIYLPDSKPATLDLLCRDSAPGGYGAFSIELKGVK
jgi:hypothetical protein